MQMKILAVAGLLMGLLMSSPAAAASQTDFVKSKQQQLFKVIAKPRSAQRQAKLNRLFDSMVAYELFAKGSLGKKWPERSKAEQKEFLKLLTKLVRKNYRRNLKRLLDYDIQYLGQENVGSTTLVKTKAVHKTKAHDYVTVDFKLVRVGSKFMVADIVTEGASMVKTYRSQFLRILRKKGFEHLMSRLKKKLAKKD
jgi:phospholipid transport system substrate-binding protein